MLRARARKADHAAGERLSTTPSGFTESRIQDRSLPATATSTQLPLSDAVLFRHAMCGTSNSPTRPPPRRVARPPPGTSSHRCHGESSQPAGVLVKDAPASASNAQGCSNHSIGVQCKPNRLIRLVLDQTAGPDPPSTPGKITGYVISPAALRRRSTESDGPSAICVMRLEGLQVTLGFLRIVADEIAAWTLEEYDVFVGCVFELDDLERSPHPGMKASREGYHLDRHVPQVGQLGQVPKLPTRDGRAARQPADDGFVEQEGEFRCVVADQQVPALGSEFDQGGHALGRGVLTVEGPQDGPAYSSVWRIPGTNMGSNWLIADAADS